MRPESIQEWTKAQPFVPFRIVLTGGESFEVRHPEFAMPTRMALLVARPNLTENGIPESATFVSYFHIVKIEPLPTAAIPPGANGVVG